MKKPTEILIVAAVVVVSAVPRFASLGRFTSIDEPFWLRQSGNFYYALGQREFQNTLYEYHPAVTTMWIITAGMLIYFPEYRALGQGYLKPSRFDEFLVGHGKSLLELLVVSRAVQVVVLLALLATIYVLLRAFLDRWSALFATSSVSLSPFLIGQSRLLNHEAMVGLLSLVSMLGMLVYFERGRRLALLLLSAAAAGLAQLTKSSAFPIIALVTLMILAEDSVAERASLAMRLLESVKTLGVWLAAAAATYFIAWPGMWVAPLAMLQDVYGNALSYAVQGARSSVAPGTGTSGFGIRAVLDGIGLYANDLVWRTTPITVAGVVSAAGLVWRRTHQPRDARLSKLVLYSLILAAAFVFLFGIQRGPKPPHYILTSYAALDLIAALGLLRLWSWLRSRLPVLHRTVATGTAILLTLGLQATSALSAFPYFISYYNPVVEALQPGIQNPTLNENGYGMGLDAAARYLAKKPNAPQLAVLSSNGLGSFSYYFPGRTVPMNNFSMQDPQIAAIVPEVDYVVVDYYNHKRKHVDQDLDSVQAEHSIWLNGIEFLRIYRATDFLPNAN